MQNSILLNDAMQAKPAGIHVNVNEGMKSLKCAISREAKRLWATRSETFSYLCEESVSYGDVVLTMAGMLALVMLVFIGGYLFGGEVM
jgi:hypothetical protein|uniref:Uncharacterized protein n=1 Tax=Siphoviridae sp. ctNDP2 TaxID=2826265 RepID=A0A8S5NF89_9CAUD|nr:MAG TPA: hypothetical protein [Siphoviridae sp. ctNDP2]